MTPSLRIERANLDSMEAQELIEALNRELSERYPEGGANFFRLDSDEVVQGRGVFVLAFLDDRPLVVAP